MTLRCSYSKFFNLSTSYTLYTSTLSLFALIPNASFFCFTRFIISFYGVTPSDPYFDTLPSFLSYLDLLVAPTTMADPMDRNDESPDPGSSGM